MATSPFQAAYTETEAWEGGLARHYAEAVVPAFAPLAIERLRGRRAVRIRLLAALLVVPAILAGAVFVLVRGDAAFGLWLGAAAGAFGLLKLASMFVVGGGLAYRARVKPAVLGALVPFFGAMTYRVGEAGSLADVETHRRTGLHKDVIQWVEVDDMVSGQRGGRAFAIADLVVGWTSKAKGRRRVVEFRGLAIEVEAGRTVLHPVVIRPWRLLQIFDSEPPLPIELPGHEGKFRVTGVSAEVARSVLRPAVLAAAGALATRVGPDNFAMSFAGRTLTVLLAHEDGKPWLEQLSDPGSPPTVLAVKRLAAELHDALVMIDALDAALDSDYQTKDASAQSGATP